MKKALLAGAAFTFALTGAAWADIKIATAGPMTGDYAAFGAQMRPAPSRRSPTSTPPAASWASS